MRTVILSFFALSLAGCGLTKDSKSNREHASNIVPEDCPGFLAYQKHILPWIQAEISQTQYPRRCADCHEMNRGTINGFGFASYENNYTVGYLNAKRVVNFNDPSQSQMVLRSADGHCNQTNCGVAKNKTDLIDLIAKWGNEGGSVECAPPDTGGGTTGGGGGGSEKCTDALSLSSLSQTPTHMEFPLRVGGARVTFDVSISKNNDAYLFTQTRVMTNLYHPIRIAHIKLTLNGKTDNLAFMPVNSVVPSNTFARVSTATAVLLKEGTDKVHLCTDRLEVTTIEKVRCSPTAYGLFSSGVYPILKNNCMRCHNGTNTAAFIAFPMNQGLEYQDPLCSQAKARVNETVNQAPLLAMPQGLMGHPIQIPLTQAEIQSIKAFSDQVIKELLQ